MLLRVRKRRMTMRLQCAFRGHQARNALIDMQNQRKWMGSREQDCAVVVQCAYRCYRARQVYRVLAAAKGVLWQTRREKREGVLEAKEEGFKKFKKKAKTTFFSIRKTLNPFQKKKEARAVTDIARVFRGFHQRGRAKKKKRAKVCLLQVNISVYVLVYVQCEVFAIGIKTDFLQLFMPPRQGTRAPQAGAATQAPVVHSCAGSFQGKARAVTDG